MWSTGVLDDEAACGASAEKGGDGDQGGGAEPERKENPTEKGADAEARTKRKLGFILFYLCSA